MPELKWVVAQPGPLSYILSDGNVILYQPNIPKASPYMSPVHVAFPYQCVAAAFFFERTAPSSQK
jgi:hypothetical protein